MSGMTENIDRGRCIGRVLLNWLTLYFPTFSVSIIEAQTAALH